MHQGTVKDRLRDILGRSDVKYYGFMANVNCPRRNIVPTSIVCGPSDLKFCVLSLQLGADESVQWSDGESVVTGNGSNRVSVQYKVFVINQDARVADRVVGPCKAEISTEFWTTLRLWPVGAQVAS